MPTYHEVIEELIKEEILPFRGNFYDFVDFPLETEFSRFFDYCQEYLERKDLGVDISPARFYYNDEYSMNGCARVVNDYYLVEIWRGAIFRLHEFYVAKDERFNDQVFTSYRALTQRAEIDPGYFLFQMGTLFFLYHETGHLIQRSGTNTDHLEFMAQECVGNQVRIQHMREMDADWFACHRLSLHVKKFAETETPDGTIVDTDALAGGAALALAALYMFFIDRSDHQPGIYYEEKCHPHPLARLSYCVIYLLNNLQGNVDDPLNQEAILGNAIRISDHLMKEPPANIVEQYSLVLGANLAPIQAYIQQIIANTLTYPHLCVHLLSNMATNS